MELADDIQEIKISCGCGNKAIINARVDKEGAIIVDGEQIMIGGDKEYVSICRKCYRNLLNGGKIERIYDNNFNNLKVELDETGD